MPSQEGTAMKSRLALVVVIFALLFATHRGTFSSQSSAERLSVIDGDTLQVDGAIVQLYGIDAPELGQLCQSEERLWPCGVDAALALSKLLTLNRSSLHCAPWSGQGKAGPGAARNLLWSRQPTPVCDLEHEPTLPTTRADWREFLDGALLAWPGHG
jgi:hypothetical protein